MNPQSFTFQLFTLVCLCLFFPIRSLSGQSDSLSIFETLQQDEILHLHIKTNLKQLIRRKAKKENHFATLTYQDQNGASQQWNIKIRARGNMRNKICYLPPLKINFVKSDLRAAGIKGAFDDLKLVVSCSNGKQSNDYVLKEYLAYKLYNELTEHSFKVQLAKLTIEDENEKAKTIETYAFLIEEDKELAARLNATIIKSLGFKQHLLHQELFDKMCIFQFMIGNTDWYILNQHNVKLLNSQTPRAVIAVPYDFDYSGLVDTHYATPHVKLPIKNVRQRYFLGLCRDDGIYDQVIKAYLSKKESMQSLVTDFKFLDEKNRNTLMKELENAFEILENPKSCRKMIIDHCDQFLKVSF